MDSFRVRHIVDSLLENPRYRCLFENSGRLTEADREFVQNMAKKIAENFEDPEFGPTKDESEVLWRIWNKAEDERLRVDYKKELRFSGSLESVVDLLKDITFDLEQSFIFREVGHKLDTLKSAVLSVLGTLYYTNLLLFLILIVLMATLVFPAIYRLVF